MKRFYLGTQQPFSCQQSRISGSLIDQTTRKIGTLIYITTLGNVENGGKSDVEMPKNGGKMQLAIEVGRCTTYRWLWLSIDYYNNNRYILFIVLCNQYIIYNINNIYVIYHPCDYNPSFESQMRHVFICNRMALAYVFMSMQCAYSVLICKYITVYSFYINILINSIIR